MKIQLTPDRTRIILAVIREGKPTHRDRFDPLSAKARARIADEWGVGREKFTEWVEEVRESGGSKEYVLNTPAPDPRLVVVRGIDSTRASGIPSGEPSAFLRDVLPSVPVSSVAEWEGKDDLCCLDVDYHGRTPPDRNWLTTLVLTRVHPKPIAWHFSRGGGLHLFFLRTPEYSAEELAACAALRFRTLDSSTVLELKNVARGPGAETVHTTASQDAGAGFIEWLGAPEYDEAERDEWLESEGMECGKRYSHDKCPIDPNESSERLPVTVSETGIFCFRCNGKGLTLGSRRPGFAPWATLLGSPSAGEVGVMIRRLTHWGHAKWVFSEKYDLPPSLARLAYSAALKAFHTGRSTEGLLPSVFDDRTESLTRVNNLWMTVESSHAYDRNIQPILGCLPGAQYVNTEGAVKTDPAKVCELNQNKDLSRYGYKSIEVVHGFRMTQQFLAGTDVTRVAVTNPALTRGLPRYRRPGERMDLDSAWGLIEEVVPRIDRTLVRVLLAAFGCAQETRRGLLPVLFIAGPSAAGKTAMTQIATGILGARVGAEATYDPDSSRFRQNIHSGGQQGPIVLFNELLKDAARSRTKVTSREALDFVLNLTPWSSSHVLYTGPVKMGRLPAIAITEPQCPECLQDEVQLARRIRYHQVEGRKDEWRGTISRAGLTDLHLIRTVSDSVAKACDAILSDVIDSYFSTPMTWDETADAMGVRTIETSDAFEDRTPWLRELFRLVCLAPGLSEKDAKLYSGGFKKIVRGESGDLDAVYTKFADGVGSDWTSSRRLTALDWASIIRSDVPAWIDLRGHQGDVFIRFGSGPRKKPSKVNEQIIDPRNWEGLL